MKLKNTPGSHSANSIDRSPWRRGFFLLPLALVCLGLLPAGQAVVPPPDGGYPGFNAAEGDHALQSLLTGVGNTAIGAYSLFSNSLADANTAVGAGSLDLNQGDSNTAVGAAALLLNVFGTRNAAVGTAALEFNSNGTDNTAIGAFALLSNTIGALNTAVGTNALSDNVGGAGNTANGYHALSSTTDGGFNTAHGARALINNTTGSLNTAIGSNAGFAVTTADHVIAIGSDVGGADVSDTTWIGNVYGVTTQSGMTAPVVVSDTGQLGTVASSERFKKDIATMDKASEAILSLRPVRFHYKTDTRETPQFGLIAEEVAKVNPALVLPDKEGKPYTVRYDAVNAMLLNEFLKEHRKVEQQRSDFEAALARQQKQIEELTAVVQKVSAQLEVSKAAPQTVLNNH